MSWGLIVPLGEMQGPRASLVVLLQEAGSFGIAQSSSMDSVMVQSQREEWEVGRLLELAQSNICMRFILLHGGNSRRPPLPPSRETTFPYLMKEKRKGQTKGCLINMLHTYMVIEETGSPTSLSGRCVCVPQTSCWGDERDQNTKKIIITLTRPLWADLNAYSQIAVQRCPAGVSEICRRKSSHLLWSVKVLVNNKTTNMLVELLLNGFTLPGLHYRDYCREVLFLPRILYCV